jgi:hypothetical protein
MVWSAMTTTEEQRDNFLSKAAEAEKLARKTRSKSLAESWLIIAQSYRALAKALDKNKP